MESKIVIAMHKSYEAPADEIYLPLHVGAVAKERIKINNVPIEGDDCGDNISEKNPNYCELTGLYYI